MRRLYAIPALFATLWISCLALGREPDRRSSRAVVVMLPSPPSVAVVGDPAVGSPLEDEACRARVQQIYDALVVLIGVWPGHGRVSLPGRDWPQPGESLFTHESFSRAEWLDYGKLHPLTAEDLEKLR